MIVVWRLLLAVYLAYVVACAVALVRHNWRKGQRFTVLRCLSIALFSVLWPIPAAIGLYVEHQVRHA